MSSVRTLIHRYPALAALLVLWAIAIKAVVPAGYMVGTGTIAMVLCDEGRGAAVTKAVAVPMKQGLPAGDHDKPGCAFTALGMAMTGSAGPALLALAIAWAVVTGLAPDAPARPRRAPWLRPPLRGPPALA